MPLLRSRKYSQLDDKQILKLFALEPRGEELYFLQIEIEQRDLEAEAESVIGDNRKKSRHSILYYLFYLLLFVFFAARFGSDFI